MTQTASVDGIFALFYLPKMTKQSNIIVLQHNNMSEY